MNHRGCSCEKRTVLGPFVPAPVPLVSLQLKMISRIRSLIPQQPGLFQLIGLNLRHPHRRSP